MHIRVVRSLVVAAVLLVMVAPAPTAGQQAFDVRGTWKADVTLNASTFPSTLVITDQAPSGAVAGTWDIHGKGDTGRVTGIVEGTRLTIVSSKASGGYRYVGTIRAKGSTLSWTGRWERPGLWKGTFAARRAKAPVVKSALGGSRPSALLVRCDRDMAIGTDEARFRCTALVTDASAQPESSVPTGEVSWTTGAGSLAPSVCTLAASGSSTASCSVALSAAAGTIPIGTVVPVVARYPGDARYAPAEGSPKLAGGAGPTGASEVFGPGCSPAMLPVPSPGCGDPVDPRTGDLAMSTGDLVLDGRGPVVGVVRTYHALNAPDALPGPLGVGWMAPDLARLELSKREATVHLGTGATVTFRRSGTRFTSPGWAAASLRRSKAGDLTLTLPGGERLVFDRDGRLSRRMDRSGAAVRLSYDADGRLMSATADPLRTISYTWDGDRIATVDDGAGHVVRYAYDAAGDLVSVTDPAGGVTRYAYDDAHRLLTVTDPTGAVVHNEFDASGRVVRQIDARGSELRFAYEGVFPDVVTVVTDPLGVRTAFEVHGGLLVARTDDVDGGRPSLTRWTYDGRASVISMIDATDAPWRFARTKTRDLEALTDPLDRTWRFTWNDDHVLTSTTSPSGIRTAIDLDERGQPIAVTRGEGTPLATTVRIGRDDPDHPSDITSVTDATGAITRFERDAAGRLVAIIDPLGARTAVARDAAGWVISTTDPVGAVTRLERDPLGGVVAVVDALGGTTAIERDLARRIIGVASSPDGPVTLARDIAGAITGITEPDDRMDTFIRDARGAEVAWVDATGAEVTIVRDALGAVGSLADPADSMWSTERDALGRVTVATDPTGIETRLALDATGAVTAVDRPGEASDVAFRYDVDGRRTVMRDALGETTWTYDALGRVAAVTDVHGGTVSTSFDARDLLAAIGYPDGTTVAMERDAAGRITAVDDGRGHRTTFTWDAAGRLMTIGHGNGTTTEHTYDARGALLSSRLLGPDGAILVGWDWERDARGRVTRETEATSGATTGATRDAAGRLVAWDDQAARFDAADRLLALGDRTFTVDAAGRLIGMERSGVVTQITVDPAGRRIEESSPDGDRAFSWDAAGRLVEAGATTSAYDGDGLRAVAEGPGWSAAFTWLRLGLVPQLLGDGDRWFVWGPGGLPLEQVEPDGTVHWLHVDQAGSVRAITDASGALVARRDWDAWGSPSGATGDAISPLGFHGQYTDPGTGLQVLPQRVYDPATARFLSLDPQLLTSRDAYGFAAADPLTFTDPTGGQPEEIETQGSDAQVTTAMASVTELLGSVSPDEAGGASEWMLPFYIGVGTPFGKDWTPPGVDWEQASAAMTCSSGADIASLDLLAQQIISNILDGAVIADDVPDSPLLQIAEILDAAIQGPFPTGTAGDIIQPIPALGL